MSVQGDVCVCVCVCVCVWCVWSRIVRTFCSRLRLKLTYLRSWVVISLSCSSVYFGVWSSHWCTPSYNTQEDNTGLVLTLVHSVLQHTGRQYRSGPNTGVL